MLWKRLCKCFGGVSKALELTLHLPMSFFAGWRLKAYNMQKREELRRTVQSTTPKLISLCFVLVSTQQTNSANAL